MTRTRPDERVINAFQATLAEIGDDPATFRYAEGAPHPLFGGPWFKTGHIAGQQRTFEELKGFLGTDGYVDSAEWIPRGDFSPLKMNIGYDDGIWVTNLTLTFPYHAVGLVGTRFDARQLPDNGQPYVLRRYMADTEEELIEKVLDIVRRRFE